MDWQTLLSIAGFVLFAFLMMRGCGVGRRRVWWKRTATHGDTPSLKRLNRATRINQHFNHSKF
ncbi:MAG: hypothetical protein AUI91_15050 [Acidobacteria bacterium 13_1_40CM_3_56_11]|nr:MAG: hypothetical protein AUI91_15050 [Acidobacteria bacterium 13_1_40CM_3_56_11]